MSQVESGKGLPSRELIKVMVDAQNYAQRLQHPEIHDFHIMKGLIATPSVQAEDMEFKKMGITRTSIDLAIRSIFGKGHKTNQKAASFNPHLRKIFDGTTTVVAEEGRSLEALDMFDALLGDPSAEMQMIIGQIAEDHIRRNGAPFVEESQNEVWDYLRKPIKRQVIGFGQSFVMELRQGRYPKFIPSGLIQLPPWEL